MQLLRRLTKKFLAETNTLYMPVDLLKNIYVCQINYLILAQQANTEISQCFQRSQNYVLNGLLDYVTIYSLEAP